MLTRLLSSLAFVASSLAVAQSTENGGTTSPGWTNPSSSSPAFSQTYTNGDFITLSWNGLNNSLADLWLTSSDASNSYALRIASNINITLPGTLPWSITVNDTVIGIDSRFELKFIPTRTDITQAKLDDEIVSPGFLLLQSANAAATPLTTVSLISVNPSTDAATVTGYSTTAASTVLASATAIASSIPPPDPSASATAAGDSSSGGLSTGAKAGIGVGVAAIFLVILALLFYVMRLRQRVRAVSNKHSWGIIPEPSDASTSSATLTEKQIPGLHEAPGDRRHPAELGEKERQKIIHEQSQRQKSIYEMAA